MRRSFQSYQNEHNSDKRKMEKTGKQLDQPPKAIFRNIPIANRFIKKQNLYLDMGNCYCDLIFFTNNKFSWS